MSDLQVLDLVDDFMKTELVPLNMRLSSMFKALAVPSEDFIRRTYALVVNEVKSMAEKIHVENRTKAAKARALVRRLDDEQWYEGGSHAIGQDNHGDRSETDASATACEEEQNAAIEQDIAAPHQQWSSASTPSSSSWSPTLEGEPHKNMVVVTEWL